MRSADVLLREPVPGHGRAITTMGDLVHEYRNGGCPTFAYALHLELGYAMEAIFELDPSAEDDDDCLVHVYGKAPDGRLYDVAGEITMDEMVRTFVLTGLPDGDEVWTDSVDTRRVKRLMYLCACRLYPGELAALRRHIRAHPVHYGACSPSKRRAS